MDWLVVFQLLFEEFPLSKNINWYGIRGVYHTGTVTIYVVITYLSTIPTHTPPHPKNLDFAGDKPQEDLPGCKTELIVIIVVVTVILLRYSFLMSISLTASIKLDKFGWAPATWLGSASSLETLTPISPHESSGRAQHTLRQRLGEIAACSGTRAQNIWAKQEDCSERKDWELLW